jgi:hypothetical protein
VKEISSICVYSSSCAQCGSFGAEQSFAQAAN